MSSIFLSHNHNDKPFVRRLAQDLQAAGARVWFDEAEILIGDSLIEKIRQGIDEMEYLGVILSPNSVNSSWVQREVDVAMNQEIEGKQVKVLPFVVEECELPGFLKGKLYANFSDPERYEEELAKVLRRLNEERQILGTTKSEEILQPRNVHDLLPASNFQFEQIKASVILILGFVVIIWGVEFVNLALGNQLNAWGILPRHVSGLIGIPLSPFLHGSIQHVMLNTLPFVVLGGLVAVQGRSVFLGVSLWIILLGGAVLWAFGRVSYHVGASGLIFGYFGYLVARGWYDRSISAILVALLVLVFYSGIIWGVLPTQRYISWEGHLFGMLAGILAARFMGGRQSVAVA